MSIYGESYGTQFVQTYASAHPDHVKVLFVDGPVDLELSGAAFYVEDAQAFDNVLVATLLDCPTQESCSADVKGGNALTAYDDLAKQLAHEAIHYTSPRPTGPESNASSRSRTSRMPPRTRCTARATASCSSERWRHPLAETCGGCDAGVDSTRLAADYYGDPPCVYWPAHPEPGARPPGLTDTPYRLVGLGRDAGSGDTFQNAQLIVARMAAIEDEILNGVDYQYWDGVKPLAYGCPFGGNITYTPNSQGSKLKLETCAFTTDGQATGTGQINDNTGSFALTVTFKAPGQVQGHLVYVHDPKGHRTAKGSITLGSGG